MPRIVITGASRGLGLEFTRQYLANGHQVCALARKPTESADLRALQEMHGERLLLVKCDVADDRAVESARQAVAAKLTAVDLLVNNAGVSSGKASLAELDFERMRHVIEVNTLGPLRVTKAFLPLLRAPAKIANVSSRMGSIADNDSGGSWGYRMSKAALDMAGKNMAIELGPVGIVVVSLHPGWVRTALGGDGAPLAPPESVQGMIRVIEDVGIEQSGAFLDWRGETVPW